MHARGRGPGPDDKRPGAPARAAVSGTAEAARLAASGNLGNLSPQAATALQRSAGNAALAASLQRDTHTHGAGCGHGPSVQRSAVPDVLRAAGRPLDESVRTDMESRLGADFSDVRLHTDAAAKASAAEVGARAYTSGSHVVIGDGGGDSHTLAHELTHVIQQRQGPVAGTDNGSGLKVSDPSDRFEREAESNATRVMQRSVVPAAAAASAPAGGTAAPAYVQRATDDERRAGQHRKAMAAGDPPKAIAELAAMVPAGLSDHIYRGVPVAGGQTAANAATGLHGYDNGSLPNNVIAVRTEGSVNKVHELHWKVGQNGTEKQSTMLPSWMPKNHGLALIALQFYPPGTVGGSDANKAALDLTVNKSEAVRNGETKPLTAADIRTYIQRGLAINLNKAGETVYPVRD
ncbi:eCIS core domain-containing protein [Streptomyces beijiangensis]|uniref:eCIS core domain-containing protein n=1 Tax=Streptomyces beijiangensis TaxID=163361 RepID=UPI001F5D4784|nr:DUF4157 domain-containing protein [Streptomyces beijiangensis]